MATWFHSAVARTGSAKTARTDRDVIQRFRWALQEVALDLDADTVRVADVAQVWAGAPWGGRKQSVAANAFNQRRAIFSGSYPFARKRRPLTGENPIARGELRHVQGYAAA